MNRIKLDLNNLSLHDTIQLGARIHKAMDNNPAFPAPVPSNADFGAMLEDMRTKTLEHKRAEAELRAALAARDESWERLKDGIRSRGLYVENISGGNEVIIHNAGMDLRARRAPIGVLPRVENLATKRGVGEGDVFLSWRRVKKAAMYEIQRTENPSSGGVWQSQGMSTRTRVKVAGLPSGTRHYFRVRAMGTAGPGPWSDPAVTTVP